MSCSGHPHGRRERIFFATLFVMLSTASERVRHLNCHLLMCVYCERGTRTNSLALYEPFCWWYVGKSQMSYYLKKETIVVWLFMLIWSKESQYFANSLSMYNLRRISYNFSITHVLKNYYPQKIIDHVGEMRMICIFVLEN